MPSIRSLFGRWRLMDEVHRWGQALRFWSLAPFLLSFLLLLLPSPLSWVREDENTSSWLAWSNWNPYLLLPHPPQHDGLCPLEHGQQKTFINLLWVMVFHPSNRKTTTIPCVCEELWVGGWVDVWVGVYVHACACILGVGWQTDRLTDSLCSPWMAWNLLDRLSWTWTHRNPPASALRCWD